MGAACCSQLDDSDMHVEMAVPNAVDGPPPETAESRALAALRLQKQPMSARGTATADAKPGDAQSPPPIKDGSPRSLPSTTAGASPSVSDDDVHVRLDAAANGASDAGAANGARKPAGETVRLHVFPSAGVAAPATPLSSPSLRSPGGPSAPSAPVTARHAGAGPGPGPAPGLAAAARPAANSVGGRPASGSTTTTNAPVVLGATAVKVDESLFAALKKVPLLARLTRPELEALATTLTEKRFRTRYKMILEGDLGHECFILLSGHARVTKFNVEAKGDVELASLGPSDYFGETALLSDTHTLRGATVTALSPCHVYILARAKFQHLLGKDRLNVQFAKRVAISDNAASSANAGAQAKKTGPGAIGALAGAAGGQGGAPAGAVTAKSAQSASMLLKVVMDSVLFANIDDAEKKGIVDKMWLRGVQAGETIIQQGDIGEHWYVVESGQFDIYVAPKPGAPGDGKPAKVGTRERGAGVGELALLYNAPRAATIRCAPSGPGAVWVLDRWTFRALVSNAAEQKRQKHLNFIRGVRTFEVLPDGDKAKLSEALEEIVFPAGTNIVTQGEMGDTFYIIVEGSVVISKLVEGEVMRLGAGSFFGEKSVLANEPRAATVTALTKCTCLYLRSDAFHACLGKLADVFKSRETAYAEADSAGRKKNAHKIPKAGTAAAANAKAKAGAAGSPGSPGAPSPQQQAGGMSLAELSALEKLRLQDLKVIGTLGKGSFGHVQLVKDMKGSANAGAASAAAAGHGHTYALKILNKQQIVEQAQQEHVLNERNTMKQLSHPFIIKCYATFSDADRCYFLLEASLGGELFTLLRSKSSFPEATARFYAAGIVLAFEYMHSKGIIYRDLKPENLLLDNKGYLKVTDFGFAKKVGDGRTLTLCGTPDYLAPEVLSGQGHGKAVDWWTLGVLIYEMLAGYPPFTDDDPMKVAGKILSGSIAFPMHFSKQAIDLIKKLLNPRAGKRYGSLSGGATLIKSHPWFKGFDWHAFLARRMPAPLVPPVRSAEDLSNFDSKQDQRVKHVKYTPDPNLPRWDKDF